MSKLVNQYEGYNLDKFELPNLANATPEFLVGEFVKLKELEKIAKKYTGLVQNALKAQTVKLRDPDTGEGVIKGEVKQVRFELRTTERISAPLVREFLDEEDLQKVMSVSDAIYMIIEDKEE